MRTRLFRPPSTATVPLVNAVRIYILYINFLHPALRILISSGLLPWKTSTNQSVRLGCARAADTFIFRWKGDIERIRGDVAVPRYWIEDRGVRHSFQIDLGSFELNPRWARRRRGVGDACNTGLHRNRTKMEIYTVSHWWNFVIACLLVSIVEVTR